ncbi:hypothetical protein M514_02877 [Trichuris suis]|uniref:Large ribosomal subunit protein bL21m n=1 Tax=Trichuris suis TaxID=68888 RepID=A0A085NAY0_9BILA|nr:hypothetical protein M513_02877 [Trichuris suis]KFD66626.1 hypothetical protein M514_02877 [Trichuris suis]
MPMQRNFLTRLKVFKASFNGLCHNLRANARQNVLNSELPAYRGVISAVNERIASRSHGHLFAVVKLGNQQFKVATEDIIVCEGHLPLSLGEKIFLEKILCVGAREFTLIGTPLLPKEKVRVKATCIEKTLSNLEIDYFFVRRKNIANLKRIRCALLFAELMSLV